MHALQTLRTLIVAGYILLSPGTNAVYAQKPIFSTGKILFISKAHALPFDAPDSNRGRLAAAYPDGTIVYRPLQDYVADILIRSISPDGKWLFFLSGYNSRSTQIYLVSSDFSSLHLLNITRPQWTKDSRSLIDVGFDYVINVRKGIGEALVEMEIPSGKWHVLAYLPDAVEPIYLYALSPDRRNLALLSPCKQSHDYCYLVMNLAEQKPVLLTNTISDMERIAWSSDSKYVLFTASKHESDDPYSPGQSFLYVANADGSNLRELETPSESSAYDSLLNGISGTNQVLYASRDENIRSVDIETGHIRAITPSSNDYYDSHPVLAPDQRQIAFERRYRSPQQPNTDVCIVDLGGQNLHCLSLHRSSIEDAPVWSPDSRYIAYVGSYGFTLKLFVIDTFAADAPPTEVAGDLESQIAWVR